MIERLLQRIAEALEKIAGIEQNDKKEPVPEPDPDPLVPGPFGKAKIHNYDEEIE